MRVGRNNKVTILGITAIIGLILSALLLGGYYMAAYASDYLTITAVGDIMMGTTYPKDILPPNDGKDIFAKVQKYFKESDIVFGNLEGPLIDGGKPVKCRKKSQNCYEFRTPTRYVDYLKEAGFNVMNIANNHSWDFGLAGVESTVKTLRSADIEATGGDIITNLDINDKQIAVVGFSFSLSPYSYSIFDLSKAESIVRKLKGENDIVIVSFHGAAEGKTAAHICEGDEIFLGESRGNVIKFSRAVIDAGADMVIGHGPHVLRAIEVYKGKLIAYSLGNFLTYGMFNIKGPSGISVILKAKIDADTGDFIEGSLLPVKLLNKGIPEIDINNEAIKIIQALTEKDIKESQVKIAGNGAMLPAEKGQKGDRFIYGTDSSKSEGWTINIDGSNLKKLADNASSPKWTSIQRITFISPSLAKTVVLIIIALTGIPLILGMALITRKAVKAVISKKKPAPKCIFCTQCGSKNSPDASFCTNCGQRLR